VIALGVALAGCAEQGGNTSSQTPRAEATEALVVPVRAVRATVGALRTERSLSATVAAATDSVVVAEASGRVLRVLRKPGERVTAGSAVLELDVASLQDSLTDARLALETARVNLQAATRQNPEDRLQAQKRLIAAQQAFDNAERVRKANESLYGLGGVSQVDLREARSAALQAAAELEAARAQVARVDRAPTETLEGLRLAVAQAANRVQQLERDVQRGRVLAPFTGEVAQVYAQQGEFIAAGSRAFRLVDPSSLRLSFSVPVDDAASLTVGRGLRVTVGGTTLEARVARNASVPGDDRLVPLQGRFVGGQKLGNLEPGSAVRLSYTVTLATGALLPTGALRLEGERRFVYVVSGDTVRQRDVRVRAEALGRIAVGGVQIGERVVYPVPSSLASGSKVSVVNP
jgi:multidrug efflux pump subunit AcrA (membrane-fusion protein)